MIPEVKRQDELTFDQRGEQKGAGRVEWTEDGGNKSPGGLGLEQCKKKNVCKTAVKPAMICAVETVQEQEEEPIVEKTMWPK